MTPLLGRVLLALVAGAALALISCSVIAVAWLLVAHLTS